MKSLPCRLGLSFLATLGVVAATSAAMASAKPPTVPAPPPVWELNKSLFAGDCEKDVDVFAAVNGADLSIVYSNVDVALPDAGSPAHLTCVGHVTVAVPKGSWVSHIHRSMVSALAARPGVTRAFTNSASIYGQALPAFGLTVKPDPHGAGVGATHDDDFTASSGWESAWCNPNRAPEGVFQTSLSESELRAAGTADGPLAAGDLHFDATLTLSHC
jgi:hypothetical protein